LQDTAASGQAWLADSASQALTDLFTAGEVANIVDTMAAFEPQLADAA
jgi:hypothetical protein